ncbi:MAG: HAMP domain-containing sensor histidine kinase [Chloroflexota bacterium]
MIVFGGVRARLTASLVALVAVTAIVLGLSASWFVDLRLHDQALQDAAAQARFDLSVVVPGRQLPDAPTLDDIDRSALAETFRQRGVETLVDLGPRGEFRSTSRLEGLLDRLPTDMSDRIDRGELAFAWLDVTGTPSLVIGGRPAGVDAAFFFVRDVSALRAAVDQLRVALAAGGLILVLLSLVVARRIARGILAPVEEAGQVAERIERGDLSARVPVTTRDEFGAWAERFNAMTAALSDTIRRLEAAQQQNRRFVADVSHELRTPLAALVAEASIVGEHLDGLPPESRRAAELLVGDVRRLRALVEELMELSRFDADAEEVAMEPVDLVRLVRGVIGARLPTARFVPPAPTVIADADPRRLERILGNFLDNARDHAGGVDVDVTLEIGDEDLVIAVADRGPGVPPDRLDRIFERFARLDPSRDRGTGGSGLGLAIAAEHASLLGGYLQAIEREGGGLRLELVLPRDVTGSLHDGDGSVMRAPDDGTPPSITRERPS